MNSNSNEIKEKSEYPIQVVARRTGLSADVLRVWERRYGAVSPRRVAGGRRVYTEDDIERLMLLRQVTQAGRRISDIVDLDNDTLVLMLSEDRKPPSRSPTNKNLSLQQQIIDDCIRAIKAMDSMALHLILNQAASSLTLPVLLTEVITPLAQEIGIEWSNGELRVAHEHMATAQLMNFLGELRTVMNMGGSGPAIILTTPVGQNHELGAQMAALVAASEGWNPVYLGPNIPAIEIASTVNQLGAKAVALSIVYPSDDQRVLEDLIRLIDLLPDDVSLLVGGRAASGYPEFLEAADISPLDDLASFRKELNIIRKSG